MNGRFYFLGAILSLVLHGAFFSLLAVGSCKARAPEQSAPAAASPALAETNASPTVAVPPVRSTDPFAAEESPVATKPVATKPAVAKPAVVKSPQPRPDPEPTEIEREWKTYVVKKGDTLTILSKKTGCSVSEIAKKNKKTVAQMAKLWVGQKIRLPGEVQ